VSAENVALVRELLEMFAHRQHERVFEHYDPAIEWDVSRAGQLTPDLARVYRGHDGVREYWRAWLSAWSDLDFEVEDVLDGGEEIVALIHDQRQWGRTSGVETTVPDYALVFTIRDGKVVRWRAFPDKASGIAAAGLGPSAAT
jgi:ketosteroid isomerase-like protein